MLCNMSHNLLNLLFSVADEFDKSAIKVCSLYDRTTQQAAFLLFARSLLFLDSKCVCAGVYAVSSCYLQTNQPVTGISNVNSSL